MDYSVELPGGEILDGKYPIVVIGPNGSGKTRQTRLIASQAPIETINALRNTGVATDLPAMGMETARANFNNQKSRSRSNPWEISSEFDLMLSNLLAEQSMAAIEFARKFRIEASTAGTPEETPLTRVEELWGQVFPGRELHWRDWKPLIKNRSAGPEIEYTGHQMSDGEKAALYVAGRVFSAGAGILIVDEPETHLHSLLAVRLWNTLEDARSDIRFIYVTHDLTFALSRHSARFVLASPTAGLRSLDIKAAPSDDVTEALLGAASLSFYASRVVFCEGDATSLDTGLYGAWFDGQDTVVRPVHDCNRVMRCVEGVENSGIASALSALGVIDGDYRSQAFRQALPSQVMALRVHEVESLFCLPDVVAAVGEHVSREFDLESYERALRATVSVAQGQQIIIERWKQRLEPHLEGLVAGVSKRNQPVADLVVDLPNVFDHTRWTFSPETILKEEQVRVETAIESGPLTEFLLVVPGKQLLPVAAHYVGIDVGTYTQLILDALSNKSDGLKALGTAVNAALGSFLPQRYAPIKSIASVL
ncbi:MAG: AAA family ATPase [Acidimicrobiales bacterium]